MFIAILQSFRMEHNQVIESSNEICGCWMGSVYATLCLLMHLCALASVCTIAYYIQRMPAYAFDVYLLD